MKFEVEVWDEKSTHPTIYAWWFDSKKEHKERFEGHSQFTITVKADDKVVYTKKEVIKK